MSGDDLFRGLLSACTHFPIDLVIFAKGNMKRIPLALVCLLPIVRPTDQKFASAAGKISTEYVFGGRPNVGWHSQGSNGRRSHGTAACMRPKRAAVTKSNAAETQYLASPTDTLYWEI